MHGWLAFHTGKKMGKVTGMATGRWCGKAGKRVKFEEYNGWENKFTWLMYSHLSSELVLAQEVVALVASTSRDRLAGRLVETWVKAALYNWLSASSGRDASIDGGVRLLACDVIGSAFAYVDWDELVWLLTGRIKKSQNQFTMTVYRFILSDRQLRAFIQDMLQAFPNTYECADQMKDCFREQVDTLFDEYGGVPRQTSVSALFNELIQDVYRVIAWEHVARAFRLA
jgi:hypothetical protein